MNEVLIADFTIVYFTKTIPNKIKADKYEIERKPYKNNFMLCFVNSIFELIIHK